MAKAPVSASPQREGGPAFGAQSVSDVFYPIGLPPVIAAMTDDSGVLDAGAASIAARPDALMRYVQNADVEPLTVQCGAGGPKFSLEPAPLPGGPGGLFPPPGLPFIFTGILLLTSEKAEAQFYSGWG